MNFCEQDLGARLQSWGKKEWGDKATIAQMHEKRYDRRRGTRGQNRQQWWKDRKSGKVAWGAKSYYNAPWNKDQPDKSDKKDNQDKNDNKDNKEPDTKKDAASATVEPPLKKAKAGADQVAAPAGPPAAPASLVPAEGLGGSVGSTASVSQVNAADFAKAVAKAMFSVPFSAAMPMPMPMFARPPEVPLPGLVMRPPTLTQAVAKAIAPPEAPAEIPEDGSDTEVNSRRSSWWDLPRLLVNKCSVLTGSCGSFPGSLAPHTRVMSAGCHWLLIAFFSFFQEAMGSSQQKVLCNI